MKYCSACGTALDDAAAFCSSCGAQQAPVVPAAPVAPVVEAPVEVAAPAPEYVQPAVPVVPTYSVAYPAYQPVAAPVKEGPSVKSKILAGVGMGLAIFGFIFALIVFFVGVCAVGSYDESLAIVGIVYAIMFVPFSILGLSFCGPARKDGVGGMAATGKVFSIISIVLYGLGFLLSCGSF